MSKIRLYLDEDVWPGLATALREEGFDVGHAYEADRSGRSDEEQLSFAAEEERAIVTHNTKDFVPLAIAYYFNEQPHGGIIFSTQLEKGELLRRMLNLLQTLSAEDAAGTVRFLADYE